MASANSEMSASPAIALKAGEKRRRLFAASGLAPLMLWQLVFFVAPVLLLLTISFWHTERYRMVPGFTLDNYANIFGNPAIWRSLLLSVETAAFVTIVCAVLSYPIAYFIAKKAGSFKSILLVAVIAPFWISIVMRVAAWRLLLGENGVLNQFFLFTGLVDEPLSFLLYSPALKRHWADLCLSADLYPAALCCD